MEKRDVAETKFQIFVKYLKEFCAESTVHGIRYIAEPKRHWIERIWWALACTLSLIFCMTVILNIWTKWNLHPVIATFNDKSISIGTIPFPAVTICPTKKFFSHDIDVWKFREISDQLEVNPSYEAPPEINYYDAIAQSCMESFGVFKMKLPQNRSICDILQEISPRENDVIKESSIYGRNFLIEFDPTFTEFGLCFTFNSLNSRDTYTDEIAPELLTVHGRNASHWDIEKSYQTGNILEYPYRVFGTGSQESLQINFRILFETTHIICGEADGLQVALHAPGEFSLSKNDYVLVGIEESDIFFVKPQVTWTSDGLHKYAPHERDCYFKEERKLRFFKSYRQKNCELECLANYTLKICNCVRFYMPRGNDRVCDFFEQLCYWGAEVDFAYENLITKCNCLSDCISIQYDVTSSQMLAFQDEEEDFEYKNVTVKYRQSKLTIKFKEKNFLPLIRSESATVSDFIASVGGLLGLFMGISMLSIVELVYFFTVRLLLKWSQRTRVRPIAQTWTTNCRLQNGTVRRPLSMKWTPEGISARLRQKTRRRRRLDQHY